MSIGFSIKPLLYQATYAGTPESVLKKRPAILILPSIHVQKVLLAVARRGIA
jgi:hypothetical protein